jgi:hypothetical protein
MSLDDRDIIQIDATVIAGALILLTLTSITFVLFQSIIYYKRHGSTLSGVYR